MQRVSGGFISFQLPLSRQPVETVGQVELGLRRRRVVRVGPDIRLPGAHGAVKVLVIAQGTRRLQPGLLPCRARQLIDVDLLQRARQTVGVDDRVLPQIFDPLPYLRGAWVAGITLEEGTVLADGETPGTGALIGDGQAVLSFTRKRAETAAEVAEPAYGVIVIPTGVENLGQLQAHQIALGGRLGEGGAVAFAVGGLLVDPGSAGVFVAVALYGAVAYPMYSLAVSMVNDVIPADQLVAAAAGIVFVYGAGSVAGPLVVSGLMEFLGPDGYFWGLAMFFFPLAVYAFGRIIFTSRPGQRHFVNLPARSSTAAALLAEPSPDE